MFADDKSATEVTLEAVTIAKTGKHTPESKWTFDGKQHWHVCSVCNEVADTKENHKYETTSEGKTGTVCTVCKYDSDNPRTSDTAPIEVVIAALIVAMTSTVAICYTQRKKLFTLK